LLKKRAHNDMFVNKPTIYFNKIILFFDFLEKL